MFFFYFENKDINQILVDKIKAFVTLGESNNFTFEEDKNKLNVIYKDYGICTLKIEQLSSDSVKIKIIKMSGDKYKSIRLKSQFDKYWKENIPQKEFNVGLENNGELKKVFDLIIGIRDTFVSDITVDFRINEISFKDYRGFKNEEFKFNKQLTVLIGKNGCGKTSILEGVAVGIGAFLNGVDDVTDSKNIYKEDIRFSLEDTEEMPVRYDYPPTMVKFKSKFINQEIQWSRVKASLEGARTSTKDSTIVTTVVRQLVSDIREINSREIILPIFSYHGVGRVASFTRDMRILEKTEKLSRFVGYKDCLKPASNYKFFVNWYRKMKYREFEYSKKIPVLSAVNESIKKALTMLTDGEENTVKDILFNEGEIAVLFNNGNIIPVSYLSDGYKDVVGIISDIAYRMAILNPKLGVDVLLKTPGIVLIDEIEVHLHPMWQQRILKILKAVFPKVQFIISTHSPMIVSTTDENEAIELFREEDKIKYISVGNPKEWYMSDILRNVFDITEKVKPINDMLIVETLEEKLIRYSEMVKAYVSSKNPELKNEIESLYEELIPSLPKGNPRRRVLERLKELVQ
ncbi:AAA family ATPase [Clostridium sp.]|uniref:AAA family ATPase n=1 Tax=Clostridium sp. TaxID=1506 RepID=UPI003217AC55